MAKLFCVINPIDNVFIVFQNVIQRKKCNIWACLLCKISRKNDIGDQISFLDIPRA